MAEYLESKLLPPIPTTLVPRVGAAVAMVSNVLYMWGGRGGKDMAPLVNGSAVNAFDINKAQWDTLQLSGGHDRPEDRSYHALTAIRVSSAHRLASRFFSFANQCLRASSISMRVAQPKADCLRFTHWTSCPPLRAGNLSPQRPVRLVAEQSLPQTLLATCCASADSPATKLEEI
jgi:hypothetical protein